MGLGPRYFWATNFSGGTARRAFRNAGVASSVRRMKEAGAEAPFDAKHDKRAALALVGLSGVALACQVALTDYGTGDVGTAVFWFVIGCALLGLVYRRRSRWARTLIVVTSLLGAVMYGLGSIVYGLGAAHSARSAVLAVAFLAQALSLMSRQVRLHVQSPLAQVQ